MPTLYVENVPKDLYDGLRKRARQNRKSIAAEVISLLDTHIPTVETLKKRRRAYEQLEQIRNSMPIDGPFPTAGEMVREDRER
jgi:plasmid stability protein